MLQVVFCNDDICKSHKNGMCLLKIIIHDIHSNPSKNEILAKSDSYSENWCEMKSNANKRRMWGALWQRRN